MWQHPHYDSKRCIRRGIYIVVNWEGCTCSQINAGYILIREIIALVKSDMNMSNFRFILILFVSKLMKKIVVWSSFNDCVEFQRSCVHCSTKVKKKMIKSYIKNSKKQNKSFIINYFIKGW